MDIAVDTNILVRVFINDSQSETQISAARTLVQKARSVYISKVVQVELVWVLRSIYGLKKAEIVNILEQISMHSIFVLQDAGLFKEALSYYQASQADFSDYLIMVEAQRVHRELYSFDKKLVKSGVKLCA